MSRALQTLTFAILAWIAYTQIERVHWLLVLLATTIAVVNAGSLWCIRNHPQFALAQCQRSLIKRYVSFVCWCSGEQMPVDPAGLARQSLLHNLQDFQEAALRAKQIVRGHDSAVDAILQRIYENRALHRRRAAMNPCPPTSFLLVGSEGIGKRYISRLLAKLLYRNGSVESFDCKGARAEQWIGKSGALVASVASNPSSVILFEHIDSAPAEISKLLVQILTTGCIAGPDSGSDVSLAGSIVILTSSKASESLNSQHRENLSETSLMEQAKSILTDESAIDPHLLEAVTGIHLLETPSDIVKAEVTALLMKKECKAHQIELSYVAPEVLAAQVGRIGPGEGFRSAANQIAGLLRKPLVSATADNRSVLALRVR